MKRPRLRFTLRRLMVAVAVVGVVMGGSLALWRRHETFRRRAIDFRLAEHSFRSPTYRDEVQDLEAADRLGRLAEKYERAARRPWLPVWPDPTDPE